MPCELESYIDAILLPHRDNSQIKYHAKRKQGRSHAVSPLTNFVFEFFLFNSLYSIDWTESFDKEMLVEHDRKGENAVGESKQQRELLKFCRNRLILLEDAAVTMALNFHRLSNIKDLDGDWTVIEADERISRADGEQFFERVKELKSAAANRSFVVNKKTFDLIDGCVFYLYRLRCNIFHGQKKLGDIYEEKQVKRMAVYDAVLRCVNSLFFQSVGKHDFLEFPSNETRWHDNE